MCDCHAVSVARTTPLSSPKRHCDRNLDISKRTSCITEEAETEHFISAHLTEAQQCYDDAPNNSARFLISSRDMGFNFFLSFLLLGVPISVSGANTGGWVCEGRGE